MATCNPPHFFHRVFRSHFPVRDWERYWSLCCCLFCFGDFFFFPFVGLFLLCFVICFVLFLSPPTLLALASPSPGTHKSHKTHSVTPHPPTSASLPLLFSLWTVNHLPASTSSPSSRQMCPQLPLPFSSRTRLFSSIASGSAFASIFFRCESSFLRFPFDWAVTFSSWDQLDCESSDLIGVPEAFCALVSSCVTWAADIPHLIELLILNPNVVKFLREHILIFFNVVRTPSLDVKGLLS